MAIKADCLLHFHGGSAIPGGLNGIYSFAGDVHPND